MMVVVVVVVVMVVMVMVKKQSQVKAKVKAAVFSTGFWAQLTILLISPQVWLFRVFGVFLSHKQGHEVKPGFFRPQWLLHTEKVLWDLGLCDVPMAGLEKRRWGAGRGSFTLPLIFLYILVSIKQFLILW